MPKTLSQHIGNASLQELFGALATACHRIASALRSAGLNGDVLGAAGNTNVQGEAQQKLDVLANDILTEELRKLKSVCAIVSEEDDEPIVLSESDEAKYLAIFDPLDGSSNIDVNGPTGTIVSVMQREAGMTVQQAILQQGTKQVAALYALYGPSTVIVCTIGDGVNGFVLDPQSGEFVLAFPKMQMPKSGPYYAANEANTPDFPAPFRQAITGFRDGSLTGTKLATRYIGALVADFHRTLLKGGVYMYPPTHKSPKGKLRLLYEAFPLAMIAQQAGGAATEGGKDILSIVPTEPHQRTPLVIGSVTEVEAIRALVKDAK